METELFKRAIAQRKEKFGIPELPKILATLRSNMEGLLNYYGKSEIDVSNPILKRLVFQETLTTINGDLPFRLFSDTDDNVEKAEYVTFVLVDLKEGLQVPKVGVAQIIRTGEYEIPRGATFTEVDDYVKIFGEIQKRFPIESDKTDESMNSPVGI